MKIKHLTMTMLNGRTSSLEERITQKGTSEMGTFPRAQVETEYFKLKVMFKALSQTPSQLSEKL